MSNFLVLNLQDFGLNQDITETIRTYTPLCICCLDKNSNPLVNLLTCDHARFLRQFGKPEVESTNQLICIQCHAMLKKIEGFRKQVEESFRLLSEQAQDINGPYYNVRSVTLQRTQTETVDVLEREVEVKKEMQNVSEPIVTIHEGEDDSEEEVVKKKKKVKKDAKVPKYQPKEETKPKQPLYKRLSGKVRMVSLTQEEIEQERSRDAASEGYLKFPYSDPELQEEPSTKRTRRVAQDWIFDRKFENFDEAQHFVRAENTWTTRFSHRTEKGKKQYYRCNQVKCRGPQCAAQIYLLFESNSESVLLYRTNSGHDHEMIGSRIEHGIPGKTKAEIDKLHDLHFKPNAILKCLSKMENIKLPSRIQLNNYLAVRRRIDTPSISLEELEQWLLNKSDIPENNNEPYVIYYNVEEINFSFAIGTKALLKLATVATNLHADASNKLIWQGYPVFVIGTTDKAKVFHPLCMAVSTSECKEDFVKMFDALKKNVYTLYAYNMEPEALICDTTKSIQNALQEVFNDARVKICWTHAKKNLQKSVEGMVEKTKQKEILDDIKILHLANSPALFQRALEAFMIKHKEEQQFMEYFKQEWVTLNPDWYLGSVEGSPITNNALETFNKNLKDSCTLRERLPLSRFIANATNLIKEWSEKHKRETFRIEPLIELKDWTDAYQWAKADIKFTVLESNSEKITYIVPSSIASMKETDNPNQNWNTFEDYKVNAFLIWRVVLPTQGSAWMDGKCNCPSFFKDYMCKHVIGLSIRLGYVTPPTEAIVVTMGQRKRGRTAKSRAALIIP